MAPRLSSFGVVLMLLAVSGGRGALAVQDTAPSGLIVVRSVRDLPDHFYELSGSASDLLDAEEEFTRLAQRVCQDIEADLKICRLEDASAKQSVYSTLMNAAFLAGDYDAGLEHLARLIEAEPDRARKLTAGLVYQAYVVAARKVGADGAQFHEAFQRHLLKELRAMPWPVIADEIKRQKQGAEDFDPDYIVSMVKKRMDPRAAKTGGISASLARQLINIRGTFDIYLPVRDDLVEALNTVIAEHQPSAKKSAAAKPAIR